MALATTGQNSLTTSEETGGIEPSNNNSALTITLADLTVSDPDNSYPADFTLTVQDGVDYMRAGNTITPAAGFNSTLTVPVTVNDGTADSNVFHLSVMVTAAACHGDVSEDDLRNVLDVVKLIRHIVGLELLTGITLVNADITEDGGVNVIDVVKLIRHIVGLESLSGCGSVQPSGGEKSSSIQTQPTRMWPSSTDDQRGDSDRTVNAQISDPGAPALTTSTLYLTRFGNGSGLQADIVVFNPSSTANARGEVNFVNPNATLLDSGGFVLGGDSFTLAPLDSATLSTTVAGNMVITDRAR